MHMIKNQIQYQIYQLLTNLIIIVYIDHFYHLRKENPKLNPFFIILQYIYIFFSSYMIYYIHNFFFKFGVIK